MFILILTEQKKIKKPYWQVQYEKTIQIKIKQNFYNFIAMYLHCVPRLAAAPQTWHAYIMLVKVKLLC
jgi:hypothetical protein